jgi:hypothetical protein
MRKWKEREGKLRDEEAFILETSLPQNEASRNVLVGWTESLGSHRYICLEPTDTPRRVGNGANQSSSISLRSSLLNAEDWNLLLQ